MTGILFELKLTLKVIQSKKFKSLISKKYFINYTFYK